MRIQLQLILAAGVANFGFASFGLHDKTQTTDRFHDLFDSIAKNDLKKNEIHRLKEKVVREQYVFRTMGKELKVVRDRNAHKKMNFYKMPANHEANKYRRAAYYDNSDEIPRKDKYLNPEDVHLGPCFDFIMEAYRANNISKVKAICEEFHRLAGFGYVYVETVHLGKKWLAFQADPDYPPMQIDVLTYEIEENKRAVNGTTFYITSGIDTDCVYYMEPTKFNSTLFHLTEDVCGVSKAVFH